MLSRVTTEKQESIAALCEAIVQGCCLRVEMISLGSFLRRETLTLQHESLLAAALGLEGALPALKYLSVEYQLSTDGLIALSRALQGGSAPALRGLVICGHLMGDYNNAWDPMASMLEARASLPGCARFENFSMNCWLNNAPLDTQIRLLRALLPSVKKLPMFRWKHAFEACFVEIKAPFLTVLDVILCENNGAFFSWKVLEAAPALEIIKFSNHGTSPLKSISVALEHNALQNLQRLKVEQDVRVEVGDIREFADALEHSVCATRLESLEFDRCYLMEDIMRALAGPLSRGAFPALTYLTFSDDDIGEEGVVVLAESLSNATQTSLRSLDLSNVGMGDTGVAALAAIVQQGRFDKLSIFKIEKNSGITDQGIIALARAIDARGLPVLKIFTMDGLTKLTAIAVGAIMDALISRCPRLELIFWTHRGPPETDLVRNKLQDAGRGNVKVIGYGR